MSIQQFSRGRVSYGGGSYAPTRGQVSAEGAKGYMKREANKGVSKWGRDGQSDTRSGVAKRAMQRSGSNRPQTGGIRPPIRNIPNGGQVGQPGGPSGGTPETGGTRPPIQAGQPGGSATTPPPTPTVKINANGQLDLPYNSSYAAGTLEAFQGYNADLLDIQQQRQQQAMDFMRMNRQGDLDYGNLKRSTLNNAAGTGTAFSSGYGLAVGNNANAYNTFKNDLTNQNALATSGFDNQQAQIVDNFNTMLSQNTLNYADGLAGDAGDLGFGVNEPSYPGSDKGKDGKNIKKNKNKNNGGGRQDPIDPRKKGKGKGPKKANHVSWGPDGGRYQAAAKAAMKKRGRK